MNNQPTTSRGVRSRSLLKQAFQYCVLTSDDMHSTVRGVESFSRNVLNEDRLGMALIASNVVGNPVTLHRI
jgi:hypothetical protein